ncbi:MAG: hypothetical protein JWO05_3374 [Gemmatimonadetes bacterium]|nr:hypothetical protein [Gemmatimonadota bacterium]
MNASRITVAIATAALLGATACEDGKNPAAVAVDPATTVPTGAVQVLVQQQPVTTPGRLTFAVKVLTKDVSVGAYQGALTFEPGSFELVSIESASAKDGEFHIVNSSEFAKGRIRFAAYATESFDGSDAFTITVKPLVPLENAKLVGALDVAGEVTGAAVSKTMLQSSRGILEARTNRVVVP